MVGRYLEARRAVSPDTDELAPPPTPLANPISNVLPIREGVCAVSTVEFVLSMSNGRRSPTGESHSVHKLVDYPVRSLKAGHTLASCQSTEL